MNRVLAAACALLLTGTAVGAVAGPAHAAGERRIDLGLLVLTDGDAPVDAITDALEREGVPYTGVNLQAAGRPPINGAFLADTVNGMPRAKFQGVVLPAEQTSLLSEAEHAAIDQFQADFGVRSVSAYNWANPGVGLDYAAYAGPVDGVTATVTDYARGNGWDYLAGPVQFEDNDPSVNESWAYLAEPLANQPAGASFDPVLTATVDGQSGTLAGVRTRGAEQDLILTVAANKYQAQSRAMARGIINWVTKGVHLGYSRNYLSVHVDDVLSPDARWDVANNCTPGEDCPAGSGASTQDILMTPGDVTAVRDWQSRAGQGLWMVFNAGPAAERSAAGDSALNQAFIGNRSAFRWINHTYTHPYLGCEQDFTTIPWTCARDEAGNMIWTSQATIESEIKQNRTWAGRNGITQANTELVTGEHSGLASLPQMATDNPNLAPALNTTGVRYVASDASREFESRTVGAARTLPRYPMNVFYNVGTEAEMADLYNWIYTTKADGGSGICETDPRSTCITPLPTSTGYREYIVPREAQVTLRHMTGNDPRPHYAHQSNLAEDRILLTVLDATLDGYRRTFAANTPAVDPSMTVATQELVRQATWRSGQAKVAGYIVGNKVTITTTASQQVPFTAPVGTKRGSATFGEAYAGTRSAWTQVKSSLTLTLPTAIAVDQATTAAPVASTQVVTTTTKKVAAVESGSTSPQEASTLTIEGSAR